MTPIQRMFVDNPPSDIIARCLNEYKQTTCRHGRNPCILRCGVTTHYGSYWEPIPKIERLAWLFAVFG